MDKPIIYYIKMIVANFMFMAAITLLFYQISVYIRTISGVGAVVNNRLNTTATSNGFGYGDDITIEDKVTSETPTLSRAQVYYDLLSISDSETREVVLNGTTLTKEDISNFKLSVSDDSYGVTKVSNLIDNYNYNTKFEKIFTQTKIVYKLVG